jgi:hypothetical protein
VIHFVFAANHGFERRYHIFDGEFCQVSERAQIDAQHGSAAPAYEPRRSDHSAVASERDQHFAVVGNVSG